MAAISLGWRLAVELDGPRGERRHIIGAGHELSRSRTVPVGRVGGVATGEDRAAVLQRDGDDSGLIIIRGA